ncbi:hypothetical protein HDV03_001429 [Kappamyces sp. JEL0829]|nr:hypothetical protein HDV03_001429 [Kappamyces sp. JEL0829]
MTLVEGVLLAISGNICTGTSQVLQKRALSRLEEKRQRLAREGLPTHNVKRYLDQEWVLGIGLSYLGDITNFVAYSKANPALLAPLGIISIFTALALANLLLGEEITAVQKRGYGMSLVGVVCIMLASPKSERSIGESTLDLFAFLTSAHFVQGFFFLLVLQSMLVFGAVSSKIPMLPLFVMVCSVFGALTISLGKIVAQFAVSLSFRSFESNPDFIGPLSIIRYPTYLDYALFLVFITTALVSCTVLQEFFKQKCLDHFPVTRFFPLFYAALNCSVILSSVYFWSRFETGHEFRWFCLLFSIGMSLIVAGISIVQGQMVKPHYVRPDEDQQPVKPRME